MKIHNYDRVTGQYLGSSDADPSPLEPGGFLVPAFATATPPPEPEGGKVPSFNAVTECWSLVSIAAPEVTPPAPEVTLEVKELAWRSVVREYADMVAAAYDFDNIAEAVTYADEPAVPVFQVLGAALRAWRSVLWQAFDMMCAEVRGNVLAEPADKAELIARMPAFTAPDTSQIGIEPYVPESE
jgi:hypothetical protein